jgi:hypothetical protein
MTFMAFLDSEQITTHRHVIRGRTYVTLGVIGLRWNEHEVQLLARA